MTGSILLGGCFTLKDKDCFCEGEELDFAVVGDLVGEWADPENEFPIFGFDRDHRIRFWGERRFGCAPGELPLIVGSKTQKSAALDSSSWELVEGVTRAGVIDMVYFRDGTVYHRLHFELNEDTLSFQRSFENDPDVSLEDSLIFEHQRISDEPVPVPETPPCE